MTQKNHAKWALWCLLFSAILGLLFEHFSHGFVTFYQALNEHDYTYLALLSGSNSDDSVIFPIFAWACFALALIGLCCKNPIPILFMAINGLWLLLYPFYDGDKPHTLIFNTIWHEHNIWLILWLLCFALFELYSLQAMKRMWWG